MNNVSEIEVSFPYGKKRLNLFLPEDKTYIVESKPAIEVKPKSLSYVSEVIDSPISSERLDVLVRRASRISILITDKTRATPIRELLLPVLEKISKIGFRKEEINIIVAPGLHEPHKYDDFIELMGKDIVDEYNVFSHDSDNAEELSYLGKTSYGTEVYVNKNVVNSDLVIGIGMIEPHFFAGYSGGRKLILPGVSGTKTVYQNHGYKMIAHPKADYGILQGNPIHEDMVEASKMVTSYKFIVHAIIDKNKKILDVVAGDVIDAHLEGVKKAEKHVSVTVPFKSDITFVTNGGYPLDRNLYQAVKGMKTAARVTKKKGVIIYVGECSDGVGHEKFGEILKVDKDPRKILRYIESNEPLRDQWNAQILAQLLLDYRIIVVTKGIKHSELEEMNLIPASTLEEAKEIACRLTICEKIIAIPEGPYVMPYTI